MGGKASKSKEPKESAKKEPKEKGGKAPKEPKKKTPKKQTEAEEGTSKGKGTKPKKTDKGKEHYDADADAEETDRLYQKYMADVDKHAKKRGELMEESKAAYEAGDGKLAKEKSNAAKAEGEKMEAARKKAGKAIFKAKNKGNPEGTLDLHGLQVQMAMDIVEEKLEEFQEKGMEEMLIIPGKGSHSGKEGAKVKPALLKWLKEKGFTYEEESGGGAYRVQI